MITLRSYQNEAIESIFRYYQDGGKGNIVIAMPTATGKSLVLAECIRRILSIWPEQRVIALTHVKELIEQNAAQLRKVWPHAPLGIYSAGLGSREFMHPIVYGGVASVIKCVEKFGHRDLLFIDECHLLSPDNNTMYRRIIEALRQINPYLKVIGLTATMFRMKQGLITEGENALFTDCPFNICDIDGFHRLVIEGFLSPPIPKATRTKIDTSKVKISRGEFNQDQLQATVDRPDITYAAIRELCEWGNERRSWLVFCTGIEHAEHCAETLKMFGITAEAVHSKISSDERESILKAFKAGELRAVTNNNVLTTGFDHPPIDLIGMLRPTVSSGLWVQMLGRGTRPFEGEFNGEYYRKQNCLVLDFAGNTKRLGPIDNPDITTRRRAQDGEGDVPVKICPACQAYNHLRVTHCEFCGEPFPFKEKINRTADTTPLLTGGLPQVETFKINHVWYHRHIGKKSGKASIKVTYQCGLRAFNDFVTFDTGGYPLHKAHEWWRQRFTTEPPLSTDMALTQISHARVPKAIKVWINQPYPKVMSYEW